MEIEEIIEAGKGELNPETSQVISTHLRVLTGGLDHEPLGSPQALASSRTIASSRSYRTNQASLQQAYDEEATSPSHCLFSRPMAKSAGPGGSMRQQLLGGSCSATELPKSSFSPKPKGLSVRTSTIRVRVALDGEPTTPIFASGITPVRGDNRRQHVLGSREPSRLLDSSNPGIHFTPGTGGRAGGPYSAIPGQMSGSNPPPIFVNEEVFKMIEAAAHALNQLQKEALGADSDEGEAHERRPSDATADPLDPHSSAPMRRKKKAHHRAWGHFNMLKRIRIRGGHPHGYDLFPEEQLKAESSKKDEEKRAVEDAVAAATPTPTITRQRKTWQPLALIRKPPKPKRESSVAFGTTGEAENNADAPGPLMRMMSNIGGKKGKDWLDSLYGGDGIYSEASQAEVTRGGFSTMVANEIEEGSEYETDEEDDEDDDDEEEEEEEEGDNNVVDDDGTPVLPKKKKKEVGATDKGKKKKKKKKSNDLPPIDSLSNQTSSSSGPFTLKRAASKRGLVAAVKSSTSVGLDPLEEGQEDREGQEWQEEQEGQGGQDRASAPELGAREAGAREASGARPPPRTSAGGGEERVKPRQRRREQGREPREYEEEREFKRKQGKVPPPGGHQRAGESSSDEGEYVDSQGQVVQKKGKQASKSVSRTQASKGNGIAREYSHDAEPYDDHVEYARDGRLIHGNPEDGYTKGGPGWVRTKNSLEYGGETANRPQWRPGGALPKNVAKGVKYEAAPWEDPHKLMTRDNKTHPGGGTRWRPPKPNGDGEGRTHSFWSTDRPAEEEVKKDSKDSGSGLDHPNWVPTAAVMPKPIVNYVPSSKPKREKAIDTSGRATHSDAWRPGGASMDPPKLPPPPRRDSSSESEEEKPLYGAWRMTAQAGSTLDTPSSLGGGYQPPPSDPYVPGGAVLRQYKPGGPALKDSGPQGPPTEKSLSPPRQRPEKPKDKDSDRSPRPRKRAPRPQPVYYHLDMALGSDDGSDSSWVSDSGDSEDAEGEEGEEGEDESEEQQDALIYPEGTSPEKDNGVAVRLITYRSGNVITGMAMRVLWDKLSAQFIPEVSAFVEMGIPPGALWAEPSVPLDQLPVVRGSNSQFFSATSLLNLSAKPSQFPSAPAPTPTPAPAPTPSSDEVHQGATYVQDRAETKPLMLLPRLNHPAVMKALHAKLAAAEAEKNAYTFKATPTQDRLMLSIPGGTSSAPVSPIGRQSQGGLAPAKTKLDPNSLIDARSSWNGSSPGRGPPCTTGSSHSSVKSSSTKGNEKSRGGGEVAAMSAMILRGMHTANFRGGTASSMMRMPKKTEGSLDSILTQPVHMPVLMPNHMHPVPFSTASELAELQTRLENVPIATSPTRAASRAKSRSMQLQLAHQRGSNQGEIVPVEMIASIEAAAAVSATARITSTAAKAFIYRASPEPPSTKLPDGSTHNTPRCAYSFADLFGREAGDTKVGGGGSGGGGGKDKGRDVNALESLHGRPAISPARQRLASRKFVASHQGTTISSLSLPRLAEGPDARHPHEVHSPTSLSRYQQYMCQDPASSTSPTGRSSVPSLAPPHPQYMGQPPASSCSYRPTPAGPTHRYSVMGNLYVEGGGQEQEAGPMPSFGGNMSRAGNESLAVVVPSAQGRRLPPPSPDLPKFGTPSAYERGLPPPRPEKGEDMSIDPDLLGWSPEPAFPRSSFGQHRGGVVG